MGMAPILQRRISKCLFSQQYQEWIQSLWHLSIQPQCGSNSEFKPCEPYDQHISTPFPTSSLSPIHTDEPTASTSSHLLINAPDHIDMDTELTPDLFLQSITHDLHMEKDQDGRIVLQMIPQNNTNTNISIPSPAIPSSSSSNPVDQVFHVETPATTKSTTKRKLTGHRILTSDEKEGEKNEKRKGLQSGRKARASRERA